MAFQLKQKIESLETKLEDSESEKKSLTQQLTDKQGQVRKEEGERGWGRGGRWGEGGWGTSGEGVNLAQNIYSRTSVLRSPTGQCKIDLNGQ